ncbi:MAG TPA: hypothetical protein VJ276_16230 [Thermoanaerobaculia bacterium]|nr:hypothetical protein [Thermoanaerobaculia bacterium]
MQANDCAAIDVRSLPPLPAEPLLPENIRRILREVFRSGPARNDRQRHDLTVTWRDGAPINVTLWTVTTRPFYGGARRWFVCPKCEGRCAKLYAPNRSDQFACRLCWKLVYWSQYLKNPDYLAVYRFIHPPSKTASARRQRGRRLQKKLESMSEAQLLAHVARVRRRVTDGS